jgi:hypothetical protein
MRHMNRNCSFLLSLVVACALSACSSSEPPAADTHPSVQSTAPQASGGGTISATPNPAPAGPQDLAETTVTWKTADETPGEVYVATNNGSETLFARGSSGSLKAPWIQSKATYEFRLYAGTEHRTMLAKVDVTRSEK